MANEAISVRESQPDVVIKRQLQGKTRTIKLKKDLTVKVHRERDGSFYVHNWDVMSFGSGKTIEEALAEFSRIFDWVWGFLETKTDEKLRRDVRTIRANCMSFVKGAGE